MRWWIIHQLSHLFFTFRACNDIFICYAGTALKSVIFVNSLYKQYSQEVFGYPFLLSQVIYSLYNFHNFLWRCFTVSNVINVRFNLLTMFSSLTIVQSATAVFWSARLSKIRNRHGIYVRNSGGSRISQTGGLTWVVKVPTYYYGHFVPKNFIKMKNIGLRGGPLSSAPLDPSMEYCSD